MLEVDARVVPRVAVARVTRFHGNKRRLGSVRRGMLEQGARRVGAVAAAVQERAEAAHAARLTQLVEEGSLLAVFSESGAGWRFGRKRGLSALKQFRLEEGHVIFERVGLWTGNGTLDLAGLQTTRDEGQKKEVDGVFETASVVTSVAEQQLLDDDFLVAMHSRLGFTKGDIDFVLVSEFLSSLKEELVRPDKHAELFRSLELELMGFWYHALSNVLANVSMSMGCKDKPTKNSSRA